MIMTRQQIEWAGQHDWFLKESFTGILVKSTDITSNGEYETTIREFKDFNRLKDWAGY